MKRSNFPFHSWVPKPLGIFIYILMFVPALFISGAYTSNVGEMVGSLGNKALQNDLSVGTDGFGYNKLYLCPNNFDTNAYDM